MVSETDREISRKFDWEYFDGPRRLGYGGYRYDPKFFGGVVEDFISFYGLTSESRILDVGCGKGFMLHEFKNKIGCTVRGLDVSAYCLDNAVPQIKPFFDLGSCEYLPYEDDSFDLVISVATIHNLEFNGVVKSIQEINRVSRRHAFIKVNGYKTFEEKLELHRWNLVAKYFCSVAEWEELFDYLGYEGEYDFFIP